MLWFRTLKESVYPLEYIKIGYPLEYIKIGYIIPGSLKGQDRNSITVNETLHNIQ